VDLDPPGGDEEESMQNLERMKTILQVRPDACGQWTVNEIAWDSPPTCFDDPSDALQYAIAVAKTRLEARVELYSEAGALISSDHYRLRLNS
jgi:hypothetical protein